MYCGLWGCVHDKGKEKKSPWKILRVRSKAYYGCVSPAALDISSALVIVSLAGDTTNSALFGLADSWGRIQSATH